MPSRKWMVRGLVFSVVVCVAGAGLLYQRWTNPAAVRRQVLEHLNKHFVGANVTIESAHMRLFGGIAVRELRMSRRDDTDHTDFAYIPNAVIYHDKEKMLDGELNIRKIELYKPRIRVTRFRDGSWNLAGVLGPVDLNRSIPTIVIQQGTIIVEDRQAAIGTPPVEIKDVDLTVVNDPRPTLVFHGTGKPETGGTIQVSGKLQRKSADTAVTLEALDIPVGPATVQRLAGHCPELAEHARQLDGAGKLKKLKAELSYHPGNAQPWNHDVQLQLTLDKLNHARLPMPLDHVETSFHLVNGQVTFGEVKAKSGPVLLEVKVRDLTPRLGPERLSGKPFAPASGERGWGEGAGIPNRPPHPQPLSPEYRGRGAFPDSL